MYIYIYIYIYIYGSKAVAGGTSPIWGWDVFVPDGSPGRQVYFMFLIFKSLLFIFKLIMQASGIVAAAAGAQGVSSASPGWDKIEARLISMLMTLR